MDKKIIESLKSIEKWLNEISSTNDMIISETGHLRTALLNLKIEDARISENTGIVPIANQIQRVIDNLHDNVEILRNRGRKELRAEFENVKDYFKKEGIKINE